MKALDDDTAVFSTLRDYPVYRSFPVQKFLTPPAVGVLSKALQYGCVRFDREDDGMKLCFEKGWVHVDIIDPPSVNEWCFLPSRLHEK
jgi:hypothetical protein